MFSFKRKEQKMSEKRRDNKKRILRNGETQRKDGRYAYTYVGCDGKQKFLYSWKLESTDKLPTGKRECIALREQIKQLQQEQIEGIMNNQNIPMSKLCDVYKERKKGLKISSVQNIAKCIKKNTNESSLQHAN